MEGEKVRWKEGRRNSKVCVSDHLVLLSSQILLLFTLFFLLLAVLSNWVRHTVIISTLKRIKAVFSRCVLGVWEKS